MKRPVDKPITVLEEGAAAYRRSIRLRPDYAPTHQLLAAARRHQRYDGDVKAMETLFAKASLPPEERIDMSPVPPPARPTVAEIAAALDALHGVERNDAHAAIDLAMRSEYLARNPVLYAKIFEDEGTDVP